MIMSERKNLWGLKVGLLGLFIFLAAGVFAQSVSIIEQARIKAQGHVDATALDFPDDYANSRVTGTPTPCYDLDGNLSGYIFDVTREGKAVGYVTVSLTASGPRVVEACNGVSPAENRNAFLKEMAKTATNIRVDDSKGQGRIIYVGGMSYFLSVPGVGPKAGTNYVRLQDFKPADINELQRMQSVHRATLAAQVNMLKTAQTAPTSVKRVAGSPTPRNLNVLFPMTDSITSRGFSTYIMWNVLGPVKKIRIELWKNSHYVKKLTSSVSAVMATGGALTSGTAVSGWWKWGIPSDITPGNDYSIKIVDTEEPSAYSRGGNFYITGSKVISGTDPFIDYRGTGNPPMLMAMQYYSKKGFPLLYEKPNWFTWKGPDNDPVDVYTTRKFADIMGDAGGFPKSGGVEEDYVGNTVTTTKGVQAVMGKVGYDDFITTFSMPTPAETLQGLIDDNRPDMIANTAEYDSSAIFVFGYSFFTDTANRSNRNFYVYNTVDRFRHIIVDNLVLTQPTTNTQTTTSTAEILLFDLRPPLMSIAYPTTKSISFSRGQIVNIQWGSWASQKGFSKVNIDLLQNNVKKYAIASNVSNNFSYKWTVPYTQSSGSGFKVRITAATSQTITDQSSYSFQIVTVPNLTSPQGSGWAWRVGQTGGVRWVGFTGPTVRIELLKGSSLAATISSKADNNGAFNYLVPATMPPGSDYKVRITSNYNNVSDSSDSSFRITPVPKVTSPATTVTWTIGTTNQIKWTGFDATTVKIELMEAGEVAKIIAAKASNKGSFSWKIGTDISAAADYKIRITSNEHKSDTANSGGVIIEDVVATRKLE